MIFSTDYDWITDVADLALARVVQRLRSCCTHTAVLTQHHRFAGKALKLLYTANELLLCCSVSAGLLHSATDTMSLQHPEHPIQRTSLCFLFGVTLCHLGRHSRRHAK